MVRNQEKHSPSKHLKYQESCNLKSVNARVGDEYRENADTYEPFLPVPKDQYLQ